MCAVPNTIVMLPAFNEAESIGGVIREVRESVPDYPVVVINDGSVDETARVAEAAGAGVLDMPCNVGVGGAVQAGFRYAFDQGYDYAVRCDGDGQHPPSEIPRLVEGIADSDVDLVIGSRFLQDEGYMSTPFRQFAVTGLGWLLSAICRRRVTDPTSGFQVLNRALLYFFSRCYPVDYPEPEALALMRRQGYDYVEVPARFRERTAGQSTIHGWGTAYYAVKVFLALIVDRARPVDPRLSRTKVIQKL